MAAPQSNPKGRNLLAVIGDEVRRLLLLPVSCAAAHVPS